MFAKVLLWVWETGSDGRGAYFSLASKWQKAKSQKMIFINGVVGFLRSA
jgi:hypothetical protein